MRMAFFFDQTKCMGCSTCTVACKDYYNVNPGPVTYRRQEIYEDVNGTVGGFYSISMSCNHCKDPACVKACGYQAISKRADGIVLVDRTKCRSAKSCISACPFNEPGVADDRQEPNRDDSWTVQAPAHPMQKCTMCADLLDKGEQPICVRACPTRAIEVGDYNELLSKHDDAVQIDATIAPYAYINNTTETKPSFLIKLKKPVAIDVIKD